MKANPRDDRDQNDDDDGDGDDDEEEDGPVVAYVVVAPVLDIGL